MVARSSSSLKSIAIGLAISTCLALFVISSWYQKVADDLKDQQLALALSGRKIDELSQALGALAELPAQQRLAAKLESEAAASPLLSKLEGAVPPGVVVQQIVPEGAP